MSAHVKRIDTEEVYQAMRNLIEESSTGEREISSTEISDLIGGQPPSIDYHIRKLVDEGRIIQLDRRGKYNRKIFKLPETEIDDIELVYNDNELEYFKSLLQEKMKSKGFTPLSDDELDDAIEFETKDEVSATTKEKEFETAESVKPEEFPKQEDEKTDDVVEKQEDNDESLLSIEELTLDERIERFLKASKSVPDAERLLTLEDKEILSVMHETIQQNIVYLKDLSDQLSTVENKQLIQALIDERNQFLKEKEQLLEEREQLRAELAERTGKFDLDPRRIRMIQQNLIHTLDTYLDQPNHTLALSRREFRKNMTEQINAAFRYILNLEK